MYLDTTNVAQSGGGNLQPAPAPAPELSAAHDSPDVAAIFYVSGGVLVRVMLGDGLI